MEQIEQERGDYLATTIEVQMLREEVRVQRQNVDVTKDLQIRNHELQKNILDLKKVITELERKNQELILQGNAMPTALPVLQICFYFGER